MTNANSLIWIVVLVICVLLLLGLLKTLYSQIVFQFGKLGGVAKSILAIVLVLLIAFAFIQIFMERKSTSIIPNLEDNNELSDTTSEDGAQSDSDEDGVTIRIHGKQIFWDENELEDMVELDRKLYNLSSKNPKPYIELVDDYALANEYKEVSGLISKYEFTCGTKMNE